MLELGDRRRGDSESAGQFDLGQVEGVTHHRQAHGVAAIGLLALLAIAVYGRGDVRPAEPVVNLAGDGPTRPPTPPREEGDPGEGLPPAAM